MPFAKIMVRPPANRASDGAQTIRNAIGDAARVVRRDPPRQYRHIINWGNSTPLNLGNINRNLLNKPEAVAVAANKLHTLNRLERAYVLVPPFKTLVPERRADSKEVWMERATLTGSGGEGIRIVRKDDAFQQAPLYVKYIPKLVEYRLHVGGDGVIFIQQKKRERDNEQTKDEKLIRNYANGWIFAPLALDALADDAKAVAVKAVAALGLDFGAVDMIVGRDDGKFYVLEVNTAPGLSSPGLIEAYRTYFTAVCDGR